MAYNVKFDVDVDINEIKKAVSKDSFKRGKFVMANQAMLDMDQYVPRKDGNLRAGASVTSDGMVKYPGPYGRAQYFGTNGIVTFRNYSTPGTGKKWDERVPQHTRNNWGKVALKAMGLSK